MENQGTAGSFRAAGQQLADDAGHSAGKVKKVAGVEFKNLIADVEDLIARIADLKDSDVARVRDRVVHAVEAAKESVAERADTLRRQAQRAVNTADDYVRDRPWQAVGVAALVGAVMGIVAARRN
ncbi:MAG: hypothetical protein M3O06_06880 [Pseudomonadota bacterium]|nr:hypothetical protein [Pseudomonadota bacterium]